MPNTSRKRERTSKWPFRGGARAGVASSSRGMGAVCGPGVGARKLWRAARDGVSQIRALKTERPYDGRIKIAAQVPEFDPAAYIEPTSCPSAIPSRNSPWSRPTRRWRRPVLAARTSPVRAPPSSSGTGIGGMTTIEDGIYKYYVEKTRPDTLSVPRLIPSAAPTTLGAALFRVWGRPSPSAAPAPPRARRSASACR